MSMRGLEPPWIAPLEPKPSAYTNSATSTKKTPNLILPVLRNTPDNGQGDLARVYTSEVCPAFSI